MSAVVTFAASALGLTLWHRRLSRLSAAGQTASPAAAGVATATADAVSVIVPARNEAHNLPVLLRSLAALSPPPLEVIVVDDSSTDDTAAVARAHGATVIAGTAPPTGWLGKPWACAQGAESARGSFLLFTDADTDHGPGLLGQAVAELSRRGADLLSIVPTHAVVRGWEAIQGIFHLLLLLATRADRDVDPKAIEGEDRRHAADDRHFCIGQFLLFRRNAYDAIGGHHLVKNRVAEDLAFCRLIRDSGRRYALLVRPMALGVRMYPEGLGGFFRGWRRNFREGLGASGPLGVVEMVVVISWLLGLPLMLATALAERQLGVAAAGAATFAATVAVIAHREPLVLGDRARPWHALFYPLFATLFVLISLVALSDRLRRVPIAWKGRHFAAKSTLL